MSTFVELVLEIVLFAAITDTKCSPVKVARIVSVSAVGFDAPILTIGI